MLSGNVREVAFPGPPVQQRMPSCGNRSLGVKRALFAREVDGESAGMEHEGVGPGAAGHRTVVPFVAVTRIADNRVPKVAEVEPDLVKSALFPGGIQPGCTGTFRTGPRAP